MQRTTEPNLAQTINRIQAGDRAAFDALVAPHVSKLRSVIRRLVAHPEDTDDLTQESLLQAFEKIATFRGDAKLSTWLCAIGAHKALDYLRKRKRWRLQAQLLAEQACHSDRARADHLTRATSSPDHIFDVHEHIAFCFSCVGRTLSPDEMAALVLRDVGGYSTAEAAKMLGITTSVLRHRLSAARKRMQNSFEDLCALVNKRGACWQCKTLRQSHHETRRGPELPDLNRDALDAKAVYQRRLAIVQQADVDQGRAQALHDLAWRWVSHAEETRPTAELVADRGIEPEPSNK